MQYWAGHRSLEALTTDLSVASLLTINEVLVDSMIDIILEEFRYNNKRGAWALIWTLEDNPMVKLLFFEHLALGASYDKTWRHLTQDLSVVDTEYWAPCETEKEVAQRWKKELEAKMQSRLAATTTRELMDWRNLALRYKGFYTIGTLSFSHEAICAELATRAHIPNKKEAQGYRHRAARKAQQSSQRPTKGSR